MSRLTYADIRSVCSTIRIHVDVAGIGTWTQKVTSIDMWDIVDPKTAVLVGTLSDLTFEVGASLAVGIAYCSGCAEAYVADDTNLYIYPSAAYDDVYIKLEVVNMSE